MKYCRGTFSGKKLWLCVLKFWVIGHYCTYEGQVADELRIAAIKNWGPCHSLSKIQAFLDTIGVLRIFIRNFAHCMHELVKLTWKGTPFEFSKLHTSDSPVILTVDTSHIAVRFFLCQCNPTNPKVHHYNQFSSITLNSREAQFSQPKLEIYGLFRAL